MLPIKIVPSLIMIVPLAAFVHIANQALPQGASSPIASQAWLVSVVLAAMGIVRTFLWVRDSLKPKNNTDEYANIVLVLNKTTDILDRIQRDQERIAETQDRVAELAAANRIISDTHYETIKDILKEIRERTHA